MAKGQQQSVGAITIWMIVFVALWLTSTVFLVILYTGQEELNGENERLRTANDRLISPNEEGSLELIRDAQPSAQGGPTVVGILEAARAETARLATGEETDGPAAVRARLDHLLDRIVDDHLVASVEDYEGASFFEAMSTLYEAYRAENAVRVAAEQRLEEADAEVARLVQLNADQKNDFDARVQGFSDELAELEADRMARQTERDEAVARLAAEFEQRREQADSELTAERQRRAALERDLTELKKRFAVQQERTGGLLPGPEPLATARQADGRILAALPGDDAVYIDLGREHRLTLGLRFTVYSADTGIPADGRGKAQIEVVSVADASAECKVLRQAPGALIVEGDLVANPVYDSRRSLSFLAVGDFDLDHDGLADPDGLATIQAMVTEWGGTITAELTAMTDFVILGAPPRQPAPSGEGDVDAQTRARGGDGDRYAEAMVSARNMAVPVLPQEVFLNFLGYTGIQASRLRD